MKTIYYTIFFALALTAKAQIEPILDHVWTIEQIDTGTQILYPDLNPFGEFDNFSLITTGIVNNIEYFYILFGSCEGYLSFDDSNTTLFYHLLGCFLSENSSQIAYYFNYSFVQQNTSIPSTVFDENLVSYGPLPYSFSTSNDMVYLHITNTTGEVATFSASNLNQEDFLKETVSLYPNPVEEVLNIKNAVIAIDIVKFYDLNGRLVLENENVEDQINVSQLPQGVYILEIETAIGVLREKLIKVD